MLFLHRFPVESMCGPYDRKEKHRDQLRPTDKAHARFQLHVSRQDEQIMYGESDEVIH